MQNNSLEYFQENAEIHLFSYIIERLGPISKCYFFNIYIYIYMYISKIKRHLKILLQNILKKYLWSTF